MRRKPLSIRGKLHLIFGLSALLPMLIITIYSYQTAREQSIGHAYDNLRAVNQQVVNAVRGQLDVARQISNQLFSDATLNNLLVNQYDRDYDFVQAYDYINELFYGLLGGNSNLESIAVYVTNPGLPSDGLFVFPVSAAPFGRDYIDAALSGSRPQLAVMPTVTSKHVQMISLVRPLSYNRLASASAVLSVSLREQAVYSLIRDSRMEQQVFVLDAEGRRLCGGDKKLLGTKPSILGGAALPAVEGQFVSREDGEDWPVVHSAMQDGWQVMSLVPFHKVLADANTSSLHILIIALLAIILTTLLIAITSGSIVRRFQTLLQHLKAVERQDFTQQLPYMGRDELGQYSESFNHVVRKLNQLINELYKKELLKKDAELYALQSQINPHFL